MFFTEWNILVVDDEPDILAVTRLALRDVTVYGLPIKIYTARSKVEAQQLLRNSFGWQDTTEPVLAIAFVDLILEGERSGLELCEFIREEMGDSSTQLYIRSGQSVIASEGSIIDDYDISGYFTKLELSEQKLFSLVRNGVRQWFSSWYALMMEKSLTNLIRNSGTRKEFLEYGLGWFGEPRPGRDEGVTGYVFDKNVVISDFPNDIKPLHDRLDVLPPLIRTPEGHKLSVDEIGNFLIKIVKTRTTADYYYVSESTLVMPKLLLELTFRNSLNYSTLWKKITDEEKKEFAVNRTAVSRTKSAAKHRTKIASRISTKSVAKKSGKKPVKKVAKKTPKKKSH